MKIRIDNLKQGRIVVNSLKLTIPGCGDEEYKPVYMETEGVDSELAGLMRSGHIHIAEVKSIPMAPKLKLNAPPPKAEKQSKADEGKAVVAKGRGKFARVAPVPSTEAAAARNLPPTHPANVAQRSKKTEKPPQASQEYSSAFIDVHTVEPKNES